jgi:hypothetical protein
MYSAGGLTMEICVDENRLKELMKDAFVEVFDERKEVIYEILAEVIEDIALARAIKEGEATKSVSRDEIFGIIKGRE